MVVIVGFGGSNDGGCEGKRGSNGRGSGGVRKVGWGSLGDASYVYCRYKTREARTELH